MDSIFFGTSIFGDTRKILIKDLSENKSCWEVVLDYIKTPHNIIIWNTTLDARTTVYKSLKAAKVEMKEFKAAEDPDKFIAFEAIQAAMRGDAKTALMKCKKMELKEEPYIVIGAFASEAYKTFATSRKAREAVRILAKADMDMKSAAVEPWSIITRTAAGHRSAETERVACARSPSCAAWCHRIGSLSFLPMTASIRPKSMTVRIGSSWA